MSGIYGGSIEDRYYERWLDSHLEDIEIKDEYHTCEHCHQTILESNCFKACGVYFCPVCGLELEV